jgi:DNA polymerase I-like protein with 3'-5' exonuclease and polymerase domains
VKPGLIAADVETTGLRPFQGDKVTVVSFARDLPDGEIEAWAEPADQGGETLRRFIDAGHTIVWHGGTFDRAAIKASFGIDLPDDQYADTQARDWLLDENADHRLKEGLGKRYLGVDAQDEKDALRALMRGSRVADVYRELREVENEKPRAERERAADTRVRAREIADASKRSWEDLTFEDLEEYAAQDAFITLYSYHRQDDDFAEDPYGVPDIERQYDIGSLAYRITRNGVKVDAGRAEQGLQAAEERIAELAEPFAHINLNSPNQVAALVYDEWGLPATRFSKKTGARSTDKDALNALAYDERVLGLLEHRSLAKQVSAYYVPLLDRLGDDGRVHPSLNPWRTVTGRFSMSGPNLQTIPRESTAAEIRKVFVPEKGLVLTEWDLSQIEIRVAADLSEEPTLLRVYEEGRDVYQAIADELGVTRDYGKVLILQTLYGSGPKNIALTIARGSGQAPDVPLGRRLYKRFWRTYPRVEKLMRGYEEMAKRRGYIPHWREGRRRRFKSPHNRWPRYYSALNAAIQGGAAEFLKDVLLEVEPEVEAQGWGRVVLTVHDSVMAEHEPGAEHKIQALIDEVTADVSPYEIATPWEMKPWK